MVLVIDDAGNVFNQNGEIVLTDIFVLQKVVQFVTVDLI